MGQHRVNTLSDCLMENDLSIWQKYLVKTLNTEAISNESTMANVNPAPRKAFLWLIPAFDEDWTGDVETLLSHTGFTLMMNGGAISWKSGLQDSVASSALEGEYMVVSLCGQEIVYIRVILCDFGLLKCPPTLVYKDNLVVYFFVYQACYVYQPCRSHRYSKTLPSRPGLTHHSNVSVPWNTPHFEIVYCELFLEDVGG